MNPNSSVNTAEKNGRKLTVTATKALTGSDVYVVHISIISTDPNKPLKGSAILHLTQEYPMADPKLFVIAGKVDFKFETQKAFLLKVEVDEGNTKFDIDLGTIIV